MVDLGEQPPGGSFPRPGDVPLQPMPLRLGVCLGCGLAQLADPSPPEADELDAPTPLSSATVGAHARRLVEDLFERGLATPTSRVLSLASHGGHLAELLRDRGVPVTVVDHLAERVRRLRGAGVDAVSGTLDDEGASAIDLLGRFDLIVDFYLMAHLRSPRLAFHRIARLLAPGGTFVLEFDHLLATVEGGQWDAIRHGHQSYLTLAWLAREAESVGLSVVDAMPQPVYGGALRILMQASRRSSPRVAELVDLEVRASLGLPTGLNPLRDAVERARREVVPHLASARTNERPVVGYGAPARAITFLNALAVGPDLLPFVVDRSIDKHGRLIPGVGIPIRAPEVLLEDPPTGILVLTWDLIDEVRAALAPLVDRGSRLLVALPRLTDVTEGIEHQMGGGTRLPGIR